MYTAGMATTKEVELTEDERSRLIECLASASHHLYGHHPGSDCKTACSHPPLDVKDQQDTERIESLIGRLDEAKGNVMKISNPELTVLIDATAYYRGMLMVLVDEHPEAFPKDDPKAQEMLAQTQGIINWATELYLKMLRIGQRRGIVTVADSLLPQ